MATLRTGTRAAFVKRVLAHPPASPIDGTAVGPQRATHAFVTTQSAVVISIACLAVAAFAGLGEQFRQNIDERSDATPSLGQARLAGIGSATRIASAADQAAKTAQPTAHAAASATGAVGQATATPTPKQVETLGRLAREYVHYQQNYNYFAELSRTRGGRPLAQTGEALEGHAPYWDLSPAKASALGVSLVGDTNASPLRAPNGDVRLYVHYADSDRFARLREKLGEPSGSVYAQMTTTRRTLVLYPEGQAPIQMKFPRYWLTRDANEKALEIADVQRSIGNSERLLAQGLRYIMPESAGLAFDSGDMGTRNIVRQFPSFDTFEEGDSIVPLHVILGSSSSAFARDGEALGRRLREAINPSTGEAFGTTQAWLQHYLPDALSNLMHDSAFLHGVLLELHTQNVDVIVGKDGALRQLVVKDLLDMVHDAPLQFANSGVFPDAALRGLEHPKYGIGEANKRPDMYYHYMGDTLSTLDEYDESFNLFEPTVEKIFARDSNPVERFELDTDLRTKFFSHMTSLRQARASAGLSAILRGDVDGVQVTLDPKALDEVRAAPEAETLRTNGTQPFSDDAYLARDDLFGAKAVSGYLTDKNGVTKAFACMAGGMQRPTCTIRL